jgi:hypothetical protein
MNIRKLFVVLAMIGIFAMIALAADVTGKWKAESTGPDGQVRTTNFTFKAEGEKLTGTVSGRQGDTEISEGKINGDEISFVVVRGERKMQYKGKVAGDEIKLSVQFGPDAPPREMVAKRVKE